VTTTRPQPALPDGVTVEELERLCVALATEASRFIRDERPPRMGVAATKSSDTDVVTVMDQRSEELLRRRIQQARPDDGILGEEGADSTGTSGLTWVIDPIDGTVNYLYGLPDWAVSIAAEVDGEVVAGVVAVPTRGELYTAARGEGAYLVHRDGSTEKLRCNVDVPLERALIATGFGYFAQRRARQAEVLLGVLPRVRDIRRGGSAAVDLCSVASGRVDGYFERGPQEWDIAAGGLIVREAGGTIGGLNGRPASAELTISAGPGLYGPLHDLLVPLAPERD
jgi:myo-inositol-1(or 4)-monophosphatase